LLLIQYESALADEAQRSALAAKERQKALDDEIFGLRDQLRLVTDDERIDRYRAQLEQQYGADDPRAGELADLYRQTIDPTFAEGIQQNVRSLRDDLEKLLDPINQVTGAANAIGEAFSKSFTDAITGASTAQEALAGFFSNVANYFLELASQIITKMITIAILNSFAKVLPTGAAPSTAGSGGSFAGVPLDILNSVLPNKDGNAFGENGIVPFAKGGLVTKPTLFKYGSGGADRFGLMGEAGPEAIMPLKRGPGGKLGVEAHGAGSSDIDIVVNVDASSSNVQSNGQQGRALGQAIGAAVQAELIKQKRPGGLLS
jgi:lambda family phage tail tape measure protein